MRNRHIASMTLLAAAASTGVAAAAPSVATHTKPPVIFFRPTVISVGPGPTNQEAAKLVYTTEGSALTFDPVICNPSYISWGYTPHRVRKHMTVGYVWAWGDSEPLQCTIVAYWNTKAPGAPYALLTINVLGSAAVRANDLRRRGFGLPVPSH